MRQLPLIVFAALLLAGCGTTYEAMEHKYQREMDPIRIKDVDFLASVTNEFFQKTGRMPLADRLQDKSIVVFVTSRPLAPTYLEQAAKLPVVVMTTDELKADLEKGLGRTINVPSDPQNFASYGPNLYIYDVNKTRACVYGHLFSEVPGALLVEGRAPGTNSPSRYFKYLHCIPTKAA